MATPKEISAEQFGTLYWNMLTKAEWLAEKAGRPGDVAYWFSHAFSPLTISIKTGHWKGRSPTSILHSTNIPCDSYDPDHLPMATCLVYFEHTSKYYTCRHKVGDCPWKQ